MPSGWECRTRLIKQIPAKPTVRRGERQTKAPGPSDYEAPEIFCGKGFSHIKRSPAYTFGLAVKKKTIYNNGKVFNTAGLGRKGQYRIKGTVMSPRDEPYRKFPIPGPGTYEPNFSIAYKEPPSFTAGAKLKGPYQAADQWTPPPNMYKPPIMGKKEPSYSLSKEPRMDGLKPSKLPGPGQYDPKFNYVKKATPMASMAAKFEYVKPFSTPAPNTYDETKFMAIKKTTPATTFGIKHSKYLGKPTPYMKPSKLNILDH